MREGGVSVRPYDDILELLRTSPGKLWLDEANANYALFQAATLGLTTPNAIAARVCGKMSPLQVAKSVKNSVEIQGKSCCLRIHCKA